MAALSLMISHEGAVLCCERLNCGILGTIEQLKKGEIYQIL